MSASVVIGQSNFTSSSANQGGTATASTLSSPKGVFVDPNGRLIIADPGNHRVLIWNSVPTSNNTSADLVLGQADFTSSNANRGGTTAANTLNNPYGVFSDGTKLVIVDRTNHRVLIWNTFPTSNGQSADVVVGQSDMTTGTTGACNTVGLDDPDEGVWIYNNKLIVSSKDDRRVLIWNSVPTTNGASADVVLGQADFISCGTPITVSSSSMNQPRGIAVDQNGKLYIVDSERDRVLVWNSVPTTNNQAADIVIGQDDFTSSTGGTSASRFQPDQSGIAKDGNRVFIADRVNNRVAIFNSLPSSNGASADIVVGQSGFSGSSSNGGGSISASGLSLPEMVFAKNNKLFVSDTGQHRVLIYDNLLKPPGLTLNNAPEGRENNQVRLKGTATVDSPYTVKNVEFSVNGGSFSGATATDGGFDETSEEYYFDFTPTSNQPKDSSGNLIDGYTVRVKSTNNNTDVTDRLFYFSPFDLQGPADNTTLTTGYPFFEFSVNKQRLNLQDILTKYQVQVRKGGSDSSANWETLIDDIPIDFRSVKNERTNKQWEVWGHLDTNNGVYETDKFYATYSDESSRVKVYSKVNTMSGTYQWKIVAVDKSGHNQETGTRNLFINATSTATTNYFPLAVLNISGLGNPFLNSYNLSNIKSTCYTSSSNPIFYGIAWTNSKVTLKLTDQKCTTDCIKTYSTTANAESSYGINVPKGDLSYGKKYTANLSVALEDKYNELPQFTLSIGGLNTPSATTATTLEENNTETKEDKEISPSPSPEPSPTPVTTQETQENSKRCIWFICW